MPLSPQHIQDLRRAAEESGVDAEELIREAEDLAAEREAPAEGSGGGQGGSPAQPAFERLLLGALPFIRVREFRNRWLGLADEESMPDDHLPTGQWLEKYGGVHAGGSAGSGDGGGDE